MELNYFQFDTYSPKVRQDYASSQLEVVTLHSLKDLGKDKTKVGIKAWVAPNPSFSDVCVCVCVAQSCLILCDPMKYSPPCSSVHGILQARILEWVAIPFSRGSSWPGSPALKADFFFPLSHHGIPSSAQFYPKTTIPISHPISGLKVEKYQRNVGYWSHAGPCGAPGHKAFMSPILFIIGNSLYSASGNFSEFQWADSSSC